MIAGPNVEVEGNGSLTNPYVISSTGGAVDVASSGSVDLTGDGSPGSPVTATVRYSSDPGNVAAAGSDGAVYVPDVATQLADPEQCAAVAACAATGGGVTTGNTGTVTLTGNGTPGSPLVAEVNISGDEGNQIQLGSDGGLYVPPPPPRPYLTTTEQPVQVPSDGEFHPQDLTNVEDIQVFAVPAGTDVVIPETGVYQMSAFVAWQQNSSGERRIDITVNGVRITEEITPASSVSSVSLAPSMAKLLNAGDIVNVRLRQNSGQQLTGGMRASIVRVA